MPRGRPARPSPQGAGPHVAGRIKRNCVPGFVTGPWVSTPALPSARPGLGPRGVALKTRPPTPRLSQCSGDKHAGSPGGGLALPVGPCGVSLYAGGTGQGQAAECRGLARGRGGGVGEDAVRRLPGQGQGQPGLEDEAQPRGRGR